MSLRIVVLDGHTLSPLRLGEHSPCHPSWDEVASLGELTVHDRTPPELVLERAAGASVLLTNKTVLSAATIRQLPSLSYIGVMATGTNIVDLAAASERGIPVTNVPGYSTPSVVQTVFSLLFELSARTGETALAVREGKWSSCPDFCFTLVPWRELSGKVLGVFGLGTIGREVARVALALGMRVLAHSRSPKEVPEGVEWVSKEEILRRADVLSLHCPLTPETKRMIGREALNAMRPGAFLLNTARGPLIDETAVAEALAEGRLGGFAADVLCEEPPPPDHPLIKAPNSIITPHMAWASIESRARLMHHVSQNLAAFLAGRPETQLAAGSRAPKDGVIDFRTLE